MAEQDNNLQVSRKLSSKVWELEALSLVCVGYYLESFSIWQREDMKSFLLWIQTRKLTGVTEKCPY